MLTRVASGPSLIVCNTCRLSSTQREDAAGRRGGKLLAELLRALLSTHRCNGRVAIHEIPCLFACSAYCTVQLRCESKLGYVLGRFTPCPEDALALLDYAEHYVHSAEGIVPYDHWPERIKNHFIVRTAPEGFTFERQSEPPLLARPPSR